MGTFTLKYFFKKAIWEKKTLWASAAVMAYLGYCYDRQGMYKASMMKGQSKMFADRIAEIPEVIENNAYYFCGSTASGSQESSLPPPVTVQYLEL
ncbi:unnamed protein product [Cercopithifilaria johnstoni]|uniref:Uncharacterized protein n=1 Tax=Cercopithifilaria johnstoni TaxID=2874296 RepID=A0A8J2Q2T4_9BILA|nr:unnamed protein product [Cercopithifilaria johnstoni]